ncbi:MAG TPA: CPBP family intramembrane glutamic endopeptidase [Allosphingosinicella sp.]|nr:CPBP family intramembrane glutamic endopeptidase [Allosphingosinicella sp.]
MTTIASLKPSGAPTSNVSHAAAGSLLITIMAAAGMALFSTAEAVGGDLLQRSAVPARMLFLLLLATWLLRLSGSSWREVGLRPPASKIRTFLLVIGGYLLIGVTFGVLGSVVLPALGIAPKTTEAFAGLTGNTGLYLYLLIVVAWGSAAFGEELVFRGFLQSRLETAFGSSRTSMALAVLAQAVIFGALHSYQGVGGAILAGATGLIIGLVYIAGGRNLWACILLHGLVDTVSLSAIYFGVAPV